MTGITNLLHSLAVAVAIGAVLYFTFIGVKRADGDVADPVIEISQATE